MLQSNARFKFRGMDKPSNDPIEIDAYRNLARAVAEQPKPEKQPQTTDEILEEMFRRLAEK